MSRGLKWFAALSANAAAQRESVQVADVLWDGQHVRVIAVVPNPANRFPRARSGQIGIEEGWGIAACVHEAIAEDENGKKRALVLIVDVPGQAFGYHEEALGLHQSLAAAVDAYASARRSGHPVVALLVGKAISGAFLAHGLQAACILALDDAGVEVHVMSQVSVARVTRRSEAEVAALAKVVPSTARDVHSFAGLGAIHRLLEVADADAPSAEDVVAVRAALLETVRKLREHPCESLQQRLETAAAKKSRAPSIRVRQLLKAQWDAST
ncbi:MAG: biotin-independent malonate decarboxylase subunit gamma [Rudaea sp.]|nr:biotin-independent malonate decarboxylase subunit gamma [Rudaea sp.]